MNEHVFAQTAEMAPEPPGIVSVNSRGGPSRGIVGKSAFFLLIAVLLITGGAMAVSKYRQAQKADEAASRVAAADANKPASSGKRRLFNTDPPPLPMAAAASSSASAVGSAGGCPDRSIAHNLLGPDGKPMTAPSGKPIRVCGNGQVVVPAILPLPGDAATPISLTTNGGKGTTSMRSSAPISRYGGEVVLPATGTGPAAPTLDAENPYIQALLRSTMRAGQPPGAEPDGRAPLVVTRQAVDIPGGAGALAGQLTAGETKAVSATMIGNRDMILPEGRSIDCNLSVRVVNEVSGKATCVLSSNVYSDNGKVVLAERGSTAVGEYVAHTAQGQRRLFILWTRLQTPNGVVVNVNSPAADALGTSGLAGHLDNRWPERIGAAVLLSLVEDAIGYETAKASSGDGNGAQGVAVFQSTTQTGQRLAERILDSTINIKPTIYKQQGDRATIFVSRDLDFGSVYDLRTK
jgi:type IV secretion system protein VirB10